MNKIIQDINVLKKVSEPAETVLEALDVIKKLKTILDKETIGVGLAAIQIGINKKVAVLKREFFSNKDYFYLINPKTSETSRNLGLRSEEATGEVGKNDKPIVFLTIFSKERVLVK